MPIKDNKNLPSKNCRNTLTSESIWDCFSKTQEPLDFNQIELFFSKKGLSVNKTTIYRQLGNLQNNGLIQELDFGEGKKRYEIASRHHHHLLCTICNKIECIELKEDFIIQETEITKSTNFKITGHMLEFLGICEKCQHGNRGKDHV
jgi:Fe2+ or Zn2+ uptake regulation protein